MSKLLTDLRSSFWFVPALLVLGAMVLAVAALELDSAVGAEALARYPKLFGAGAEGTRELLSAIASSTITVAGVVFSITIVALSLTSAQYSSRVLRSFMQDRINQTVLGVFLGIYVYCLLVLRTIQGGDEAFVPGISVIVGIASALGGIAFLILFIHHISTSIQATEITARVAGDTIVAIERQFERLDAEEGDPEPPPCKDPRWSAVEASRTGYIQSVNHSALLDYARRRACVVRMVHTPGDFVVQGETLLSITGDAPDDAAVATLNSAFAVNTYRDVTQDPAFGLQQLVEIALKALSPGVNDTATARTSLDYVVAILIELTKYRIEEVRRVGDGDGGLLVMLLARPVAFFVEQAFDPVRRNAAANVDMLLHTLRAIERVAHATRASEWSHALSQQLAAMRESIERGEYVLADRRKLAQAADRAMRALSGVEA